MGTTTWKRAKQVFHEALEKSGPERAVFVASACRDDRELHAQVEALLNAHDEAGEFMASPTAPEANEATRAAATVTASAPAERPGATIGHYKLLQVIGEGGFGVVYMAEQEKPVRRRVALKVIKLGMDTKQVIARFEAERQALAMMEHPNIARVLDAGATETGRPYFVMELVKGVPITAYCDNNRLTTRERLDLFNEVCSAVQHAHQKGIVHRDIKPSNVLVTLHDGKPVPKVIDFGIAKATHQRLTEKTLFTAYGQFVGTPVYMSPEQAEMSGLDVDTRSDIYSLGVLLYELLTGTTPFDLTSLREAGFAEIQRMIREDEPPKPSTRLGTLGGALTDIAKHRKTDPGGLSRLVRGDLDWIVMKSLEKDRTRRYASASEFAVDVARHLGDEPVIARPASAAYKFRKYVKKHKGPALAVAAVVLTALLLGSVAFWQGRQAVRERNVAEARRTEAEWRGYVGNIAGAEASLRLGGASKARRLLSLCPSELRGWEWSHLWSRTDLANGTLVGHEGGVVSVAFSPDGTRIASGSPDRTIRLWDAAVGKLLATFPARGSALCVAFSPDGTRIASGSDEKVRLWDVASGKLLATLAGHEDAVKSVAFSPEGTRIVSGSDDRTVGLWDAATGEPLAMLVGHDSVVTSVAFSPDGTRIVSSSRDGTVRLWEVATGEPLTTLAGHEGVVQSVAFGRKGTRIVSGGWDRTVRLWDAESGELLATFAGHEDVVWSVAFSSDETRIASGDLGNAVRLWDAESGELLATLAGHEDQVYSVAFSPDATRIASGSQDKTIRLWDALSGEPPAKLAGHEDWVYSVAFSPDGTRIVSGSSDETARLWDVESGRLLARLAGHRDTVWSVAFSPDGTRIASGSSDETIRLWDAASGELLATLPAYGEVLSVAFSPDGQRIASGSRWHEVVQVWDATSGETVATLLGHEGWVRSVAFSPDGRRIASGATDRTVRLWDTASGEAVATLAGHREEVWSVAFSPDGRWIASASSDGTVRLWDAMSGENVATLLGHENRVYSVAFSPDGRRIASASRDNTVGLWDAVQGELIATLAGHGDRVRSVAFSPDGRRIASGSWDNTVRLWDRESIPRASSKTREAKALASASKGRHLVARRWYEGAEPFLREALKLGRQSFGEYDWRVSDAKSLLGESLAAQGQIDQAEPLLVGGFDALSSAAGVPLEPRCGAFRRLVELEATRPGSGPDSATSSVQRAATRFVAGRGTGLGLARLLLACAPNDADFQNTALVLALQAREMTAEADLRTLETLAEAHISHAKRDPGRLETALDIQRQALLLTSEEAPLERARVEGALFALEMRAIWGVYRSDDHHDEAVEVVLRGLEARRHVLGDDHPATLATRHRLGWVHRRQGRLQKAAQFYRDALEARRRVLGDDDPDTLITMRALAGVLAEEGRYAEVEPLHREALEILRPAHGPITWTLFELGRTLNHWERYAEAEPLLRECLERQRAHRPPHESTETMSALGESLAGQNRFEEAERLLLEGYELVRDRESLERIVRLYESWGKSEELAEWRAKLEGGE